MPWGMEVWLGVTGERPMRELFAKHGLPDWPLSDNPDEWYGSALHKALPSLDVVHHKLLAALLFTDIQRRHGGDLCAVTPLGPRTFRPMIWQVNFDPSEAGEEPDQAVFGVALSSRYRPTFIDWEDPHGAVEPIVIDDEFARRVAFARTELSKVAPFINCCPLVIIQKWY